MTAIRHDEPDRAAVDLWGITPPSAILRRFGVDVRAVDVDAAAVTMAVPCAGWVNPITGAPTVAPLAFLVDVVGVVNHFRRRSDEWTVSSELSLDLTPDAVDVIGSTTEPVVARAQSIGERTNTVLSTCTLTCGAARIGFGTVRSFFVPAGDVRLDALDDHLPDAAERSLAELMAVRVSTGATLTQDRDSTLNNALGIVHGGIASAGIELAASATADPDDAAVRTASLGVNFQRPFTAGDGARYEARPLRTGRRSALVDARAVNADGTVALTARLTAYRAPEEES